jgi:hypothetical protein
LIALCIEGLSADTRGQRTKPRTQGHDGSISPYVRPAVFSIRLGDRILGLCLRAPFGKETVRHIGIETVIKFSEFVYALHRMAHTRARQQQEALEYSDRHAGRLCGDHHGPPRRIVEYSRAQILRNIDELPEFAGELTDPAVQCGGADPPIDTLAFIACAVLVLGRARLALRIAITPGLTAAKAFDKLKRCLRVTLQDTADGGSRRYIDLVDQAQRKLDVLLLFFPGMGWPLYVKRRQGEQ